MDKTTVHVAGSPHKLARKTQRSVWRTTTPSRLSASSVAYFRFRLGSQRGAWLTFTWSDSCRPSEETMNERGAYLVTEEEIHLTRGPSGLGFNIVGGTDQQYVSNDSGIYVSRIKENGAAALDGRLQEGDKILSVNGHDLKNILHQDAVNLFRNAGYAVCLRVQHRLPAQNGPLGHRGEREPSGIPMAVVLAPLFALTVVAAWAFMRYRQRL
ncbi:synaptojanin-2-binding protein [Ochotona princeps]|uniref:synaptojanin-2-binding protein n=1 Tax=Ochotona princeps TaxID=9978 RepID=UPI0027150053|nr:synaptojanin-2-binding protein [Ochotona princeps]